MNVVMPQKKMDEQLFVPGIPSFNPMSLLHGEEVLEVFSPIEADSTLLVEGSVADIQDKGKAFVIVYETKITNKETKELVAKVN